MHSAVHSARAAELDPFVEKIEKRLTLLLRIRSLNRQRADLVRQVAELDVELAAEGKALRQILTEGKP
jgi:predicted site-specific integrase-resolvase